MEVKDCALVKLQRDIPCNGDTFHAMQDLGRVIIYQENRAISAIGELYSIEEKMKRARKRGEGNKFSVKLAYARDRANKSVNVADNLSILGNWLREDVLSKAGPTSEIRKNLFDFIMSELKNLEAYGSHHVKKVRCKLENQRDQLLMFADEIDQKLTAVAKEFNTDLLVVQKVYELQAIPQQDIRHWEQENNLRASLRALFYPIQSAIQTICEAVIRASSVVENLNSRLRPYFFLRKSFGQGSLDLLRFFLNHKRFLRSEHVDHIGKSPAQLLSGIEHPHWLEMLGYKRFKKESLA